MRGTMRIAGLLAALALVATACNGADEPALESPDGSPAASPTGAESPAAADLDLVTDGTLTVCTDAPYAPMEFEEDGEFTGFDIELMRLIAQEIGLDGIEVINSGFDPITSGAVFQPPKQCDVAASSITITDEREESVDFSDPYFEADQSLLVKVDSGIESLGDLAGRTIGVQTGTTGEAYAQDNAPDDATIRSFDDAGGLFVALEAGDIDAILQDIVVNQGRTLEDDTVTVVETFPTDERYGFAFPEEGAEDLQEAVNAALQALMDDGSFDRLFKEWFPEGAGAE